MPTLEQIKEFSRVLTSLGSEPEIMAEAGEEIEEPAPPEEGLSEDLQELLRKPPTPTARPTGEEELEGEGLDFESLFGDEQEALEGLDELPMDFQEAAGGPEPDRPAAASEEVAEEVPEEVSPEAAPEEAEPEIEEPLPGLEEIELEPEAPEAELPIEEQLPGEEELPSELELPPEEELPTEEELPPLEMEEGAPPAEVPEEAEGELEAPPSEFELPDMELPAEAELELPEETEEAPAEEEPEEEAPGEEPRALEETPEEAPAAPEIPEEVELPSFEELEQELAAPDQEALGVPEAPPEELEGGIELGPEEEGAEAEEVSAEEFALPPLEEEIGGAEILEQPPGEAEEFAAAPPEVPEGEALEVEAPELALEGVPSMEAPEEAEAPGIEMEEAPEERFEEREYSPEEVQALQSTLSALPLNLRIAVEELLAGGTLTPQDGAKLVDMLIRGDPAQEIAGFASKLAGRTIELPKRFEKTSGLEFELERRTFAYNFRQNIVPILKVFIPSLLLAALIGLAVNAFIIIPSRAARLYKAGYELIGEDRYQDANERFATATGVLPIKKWFFRYAERFTEKEQYLQAAEKYQDLLRYFGTDRHAILDYSRLESLYRGRYAEAERLLNVLLAQDVTDYDALLALGDNYMEWARAEEGYYEKAFSAYSRILATPEGGRDEPWFRMLRLFIRTDDIEQVEYLKDRFQAQKKVEINPEIYAELGGYLIEKDRLDDVKDILTQALETDPTIPEIYHNFSRFFRRIGDPVKEEESLQVTLQVLETAAPLTTPRLGTRILTHNRLGELYAEQEQPVKAQEEFQTSIALIEESQQTGVLGRRPEFGKVYSNRGDIYYYNQEPNLSSAAAMYERARENGYDEPDLGFKLGYISYAQERYAQALGELYGVNGAYKSNQNYLFSLANTLYRRENYFAALGYYTRLLEILEEKKSRIPLIRPDEMPEHLALIELLMKTHNNLGVTLLQLAQSPLDPEKETLALVNFVESVEYFDILSRDPDTLVRGEAKSRAELNARQVQYPQPNYLVQIYNRIPKDPEAIRF